MNEPKATSTLKANLHFSLFQAMESRKISKLRGNLNEKKLHLFDIRIHFLNAIYCTYKQFIYAMVELQLIIIMKRTLCLYLMIFIVHQLPSQYPRLYNKLYILKILNFLFQSYYYYCISYRGRMDHEFIPRFKYILQF